MNLPNIPRPGDATPDRPTLTQGEGAQSALAAMIRKRQMHENHVAVETEAPPLDPPAAL